MIAYRKETISTSTEIASSLSPEDQRIVVAFKSPAGAETILAHLMRATALIPIKGTNKDSSDTGDVQTAYILNDFKNRLMEMQCTELKLFLALDALVEVEEFFPSFAKLKKALDAIEV